MLLTFVIKTIKCLNGLNSTNTHLKGVDYWMSSEIQKKIEVEVGEVRDTFEKQSKAQKILKDPGNVRVDRLKSAQSDSLNVPRLIKTIKKLMDKLEHAISELDPVLPIVVMYLSVKSSAKYDKHQITKTFNWYKKQYAYIALLCVKLDAYKSANAHESF